MKNLFSASEVASILGKDDSFSSIVKDEISLLIG
jgi:hypothetical protein